MINLLKCFEGFPVTHYDFSPYNAFDNNPVFWADPSGADAVRRKEGQDYPDETNSTDNKSFFYDLFEQSESGTVWTNIGHGVFSDANGNTSQCDDCNLKGGRFDGNNINDIKEEFYTYYSVTKTTLTAEEWLTHAEMKEKSMDKTGNLVIGAGAFLGGKTSINFKDLKSPKKFFKSFSITGLLGTSTIIQGNAIKREAAILRDIKYEYDRINSGKIGEGVFIIDIRVSAPAFGGTGNNTFFIYDRRTNEYLGSYKN